MPNTKPLQFWIEKWKYLFLRNFPLVSPRAIAKFPKEEKKGLPLSPSTKWKINELLKKFYNGPRRHKRKIFKESELLIFNGKLNWFCIWGRFFLQVCLSLILPNLIYCNSRHLVANQKLMLHLKLLWNFLRKNLMLLVILSLLRLNKRHGKVCWLRLGGMWALLFWFLVFL